MGIYGCFQYFILSFKTQSFNVDQQGGNCKKFFNVFVFHLCSLLINLTLQYTQFQPKIQDLNQRDLL